MELLTLGLIVWTFRPVELIGEPLEANLAKKLRDWLSKPEADILKAVVAAKMRLAQEQALVSCMKADDTNAYDLKSMAEMKLAHCYQTALDVLDEITNTPLETLKLKT